MQCSTCRHEAVIFQPYSGRYLCGDHLILDLEAKAKRAIRVHHGMQPGDHIAVILTGDSAGNALLMFLRKLTGKRKDIRVSAVFVDNGQNSSEIIPDPDITKVAVATTLEDAAASALAMILRGNLETCNGHGLPALHGLSWIAPFSHIPAEEIATYARLCGVEGEQRTDGKESNPLFSEVKAMLADYSSRHPAAPHAVLTLYESLAQSCITIGEGD
jgi:tRNA(Ile)-lysidine synthase TilS/MesJ